MKVTVEEPVSYERVLTIEVPSETVNAEIENIYSKIASTATHPGFRKGKVPRKILEKKHGKEIRQEAVESTVSSSVQQALEDHKLIPLTEPQVGDLTFEEDGPLTFKTTIEVTPAVELAEYKGITLKSPKVSVSDDDVQKVLERLQLSNAKYIPVDRPVEDGDFIILDFEAFEDGKPLKDGKAENFPVEVGSGAFGEDFEKQLIGIDKDEKRELSVAYPDDYRAKDLAGKKILFKVHVKDVKLRELPELDDEFAKDLGEHSTLDELKKHIRERLEKDMESRMEHFLREQAIARVTDESKVEIPPRLKAQAAASIFEREANNLVQRGADRDAVMAQRDKLVETADAEAARQLKLTFVADEIAKRENLDISEEELNKSLEEMVKESEGEDPRVRSYLNNERVRERYREQLRIRKILDFIVSSATIEEVDEADLLREEAETSGEEKGDS